jgi:hypothetical protein
VFENAHGQAPFLAHPAVEDVQENPSFALRNEEALIKSGQLNAHGSTFAAAGGMRSPKKKKSSK